MVFLLAAAASPAAVFGFSAFNPSSHTIASAAVRRGGGIWGSSSSASRCGAQQRRHLGMMSFEAGDFPSDVGDAAGSSAVPAVLADDNPELRETMKREVLSIAATSNR